jgi:hypothetical protein
MRNRFRIILCLYAATILTDIILGYYAERTMQSNLKAYLPHYAEMANSFTGILTTISSFFAICCLIFGSIGLFFFWRLARYIFIFGLIFFILPLPNLGPFIFPGYRMPFIVIEHLLEGIIISLSLFSPLKIEFMKNRIQRKL